MSAPVDEQLAVLTRVVAILDSLGIPHMLSGSLAAGYYAQPRMTRDIDLVVDLILAKLGWLAAGGSAVQREDIRQLLVDAPTLDWPYIDRWARELGLDALLAELRS